jgi:chaperone modulatory protein CbpM
MVKHEIVIIANYPQESSLNLDEICEICNITADTVNGLVVYGIIHPEQSAKGQWVFNENDLQRVKTALRLQRDLEINLAGVAVVLDLLDELDELRAQAKFFQRDF